MFWSKQVSLDSLLPKPRGWTKHRVMKPPVALRNFSHTFLSLVLFPDCEAGPCRSLAKMGNLGQFSARDPPKWLFWEARSWFTASLTPKFGNRSYFRLHFTFYSAVCQTTNFREFRHLWGFQWFPLIFNTFVGGGHVDRKFNGDVPRGPFFSL